MTRAFIVDDERLARTELRAMLAEHSFIEVAGEAASVAQALPLLHALKPDVLFLDIQMPGASGFDLLERLDIGCKVIFVTAHDAYAIRAFEVNALDYLLKPVNPLRLAAALARIEMPSASPVERLNYEDRLWLRLGTRMQFVKLADILCLRAADDYSEILTADGQVALVSQALKDWEARLPLKFFLRIHRSTIVNLNYVTRVENLLNRSLQIYLRHLSEPLPVSRRYAAQLKQRFV